MLSNPFSFRITPGRIFCVVHALSSFGKDVVPFIIERGSLLGGGGLKEAGEESPDRLESWNSMVCHSGMTTRSILP